MSAKEKAQELIDKHLNIDCVTLCNGCSIGIEEAKQCALMTVDEVINNIPYGFYSIPTSFDLEYWQQVKQEIEKL